MKGKVAWNEQQQLKPPEKGAECERRVTVCATMLSTVDSTNSIESFLADKLSFFELFFLLVSFSKFDSWVGK